MQRQSLVQLPRARQGLRLLQSALQNALYVEKITRLLPTYSISSRTGDDVVLGYWLTGGANIPATSFRRLRQTMSWLGASHLKDVVQAAGFEVAEIIPLERKPETPQNPGRFTETVPAEEKVEAKRTAPEPNKEFELAGRPELAAFFNEHIVDIILHRDRYKALGIEFPSAVILHGPPGCGKTFAVERLVDFLGWPSFQIDASGVASPYIHETSKKVAQVRKQVSIHGPEEVEAAASRAIEICSLTVKSVKSLLSTRRHRNRHADELQGDVPLHNNLRGPNYYAKATEDSVC